MAGMVGRKLMDFFHFELQEASDYLLGKDKQLIYIARHA